MNDKDQLKVSVDFNMLENDLQRILGVLFNKDKVDGITWLSAADISRILRDEPGIRIHWRTIDSILSKERLLVERKRGQKSWKYKILTKGKELVSLPKAAIQFIDPTNAVQAVLSLHDFLSKLNGIIRICDPYLDDVTIEHLDSCPISSRIKLLTHNVRDSGKLRRLIAAAKTAGHDIEIRINNANVLHDRYIIDDHSMVILGTSLNGFGKKISFVIVAGQDIRDIVLHEFNNLWEPSTVWA